MAEYEKKVREILRENCCKFVRRGKGDAENPKYSPFVFVGEDMNKVRIVGKAVGFTSVIK